ncbi:MAG TPA: ABC-type transport auxiliary lipoprotein family protein [Novosphingobium sp.]|nr:ABC-type transport auxiliary lipoprotein family protein [Novosphingobium sp.]HMP56565.1 ABC-type transport auxiliary lipoprotein family protein [Novosphingobium sp.]
MTRRAVALLVPLLLAGCISLGGGKVPDRLITLTAEASAPAGALAGAATSEALLVLDPDTDRRLDVQRVPVQVDDASVAYLKDLQWVERPARLFRRLLAETIRARGKQMVVEGSDAAVARQDSLSGRLIDLGYDARSSSVVVRFDALREDRAGKLEARRFEAIVPGVAPRPEQVGPALNRAANDVARQVADWIG